MEDSCDRQDVGEILVENNTFCLKRKLFFFFFFPQKAVLKDFGVTDLFKEKLLLQYTRFCVS